MQDNPWLRLLVSGFQTPDQPVDQSTQSYGIARCKVRISDHGLLPWLRADDVSRNIVRWLIREHKLTRPTLFERRQTLGHLRSINHNMIIHFANQSQSCQLLKILTRSLYVSSFLVIFLFFCCCCILVHYPCTLDFSWPTAFSLFCIGAHIPWSLEVIWRAFSILRCIVALFPCRPFITLITSCLLYFVLAMSAKSFYDYKFLSTIARASECTFGESTAAQFLLDDSPLFDMQGVPSRLSSLRISVYSVCSIFQRMFCLPLSQLSPSHLFYELYKVTVAVCNFFLHYRHDLSIDRFHVYLSVYQRSFCQ